MSEETHYEVEFPSGERALVESLWAAHHEIQRRAAFDVDPLKPRNVLPARIYKLGKQFFGGRVFAEEIRSVSELTPG